MSRLDIAEMPPSGARSKAFLFGLYLGLTLLLIVSHLDTNHNSSLHVATNIYGIQAVAGAVLGFWRIWANADDPRTPPALSSVLICVGLVVWAIGQGMWVIGNFTVGDVPYPWWSEIPYMASLLCWIATLLTLYRILGRRVLAETGQLLSLLTAGWASLVGIVLWMNRSLIASPADSTTLFKLGCDFAYILLTSSSMILALALVLGKNTDIPFPIHQCLLYLCAATAIDALANLVFVVTTKLPASDPLAYFNGNWVDWLLLTAMYCWGISAIKCPIRRKELDYTFGTLRGSGVRVEDIYRAGEIAEGYFQTARDTEQMVINSDSTRWILDNIPECWRIVKLGDMVVGSTFLFPVPRHLMERFIAGETTEREMFSEVRRNALAWDCLYLAGASILASHRKRGLAFKCFRETIERIAGLHNPKVEVFCWPITLEGHRLAEKLLRHFENRGIRVIEVEGASDR